MTLGLAPQDFLFLCNLLNCGREGEGDCLKIFFELKFELEYIFKFIYLKTITPMKHKDSANIFMGWMYFEKAK